MADELTDLARGFENAATGIIDDISATLEEVSSAICLDMKAKVKVKTGALRDSIRYETDRGKKDEVSTMVYADAMSEVGPQMQEWGFVSVPYAEFLEYGTGTLSKKPDSRKTPWRYQYKGDDGEWHWTTTHGMAPQPFIETSINDNLPRLDESIQRDMDISKYTGGKA